MSQALESAVYENGQAEEKLEYVDGHSDSDSDWWLDICVKEGAISGGRNRDALWS